MASHRIKKQIRSGSRIGYVEHQNLGRPFDKHLSNKELEALVPSHLESGEDLHEISPEVVREAERHVESCADCSRNVMKYRHLVDRSSNVLGSEAAPRGPSCPNEAEVDWYEIAAGLWPEFKAKQLMMHAALCDRCGPLLRAASSENSTPQRESLLAEWKAPSRSGSVASVPHSSSPWRFTRWLVPVIVLIAIVGAFRIIKSGSPTPLSGPKFAEFAVGTHRQHAEGELPLEVRSDSPQAINEWLKEEFPFSLALPAGSPAPGEERPYRLEGARLVKVRGKSAAFIAYQVQTPTSQPIAASLMVTTDSVASATGGVDVGFKKVSFHYATVEGYKVVTWSVHGLTYALVSQESNSTQRSCMVCHSAMRDRDLSRTPTPLNAPGAARPVWQ
jgi:anti-sigma factor RsiW